MKTKLLAFIAGIIWLAAKERPRRTSLVHRLILRGTGWGTNAGRCNLRLCLSLSQGAIEEEKKERRFALPLDKVDCISAIKMNRF